jgi:hypothetical protein
MRSDGVRRSFCDEQPGHPATALYVKTDDLLKARPDLLPRNYGGDMWVKYKKGTNYRDKFEIDWWDGDNEISSFVNNTDLYVILFADDNWNGATRCYSPGVDKSSLGSFDNDAESFVLHSSCTI